MSGRYTRDAKNQMKYGLPYLGSKSKIAEDIIKLFPPADNFYDLFAGGCAITHALLVRNDLFSVGYKKYVINDIQDTPKLFLDAIAGKYKNEKRWISRKDFFENLKLEKPDPYIKWIWSFSNNGKGYLFGKHIEGLKKEAHEFLFENGYDGTVKKRLQLIKLFKNGEREGAGRWLELEQLQQLERLQQLQQLERLQQSYETVPILPNSVIYCDPPYNTGFKDYTKDRFNHQEFWEWAERQECPVYVSEYRYTGNNPNKWKTVFEKEKINLRAKKSDGTRIRNIEKVFWNGK